MFPSHLGNQLLVSRRAHSSKDVGLVGLSNPQSSSCYINCILQIMMCTKLFREYMLQEGFRKHANNSSLVFAFNDLMLEAVSATTRSIPTDTFLSKLRRISTDFAGNEQEDADEFLNFFLKHMHETMPKIPELINNENLVDEHKRSIDVWNETISGYNSRMQELFCAQIKCATRCSECNNVEIKYEEWWETRLQVPKKTLSISLKKLLNQLIHPKTIEAYSGPACSHCGKYCSKTVINTYQRLPPNLVFQLVRFEPHRLKKIKTMVKYKVNGLNMKKFSDENVTPEDATYNLYGIVRHNGDYVNHGHYLSIVKHPETGVWHRCNDAEVTTVTKDELQSSSGYLLFYELACKKQDN